MKIKAVILIYKKKILWAAGALLTFFAGFLASYFDQAPQHSQGDLLLNNSSTTKYRQYKRIQVDPQCPVKGKVKKGRRNLYYLPGGAFYKRIKPTDCFKSEQEAKDAGFFKSAN